MMRSEGSGRSPYAKIRPHGTPIGKYRGPIHEFRAETVCALRNARVTLDATLRAQPRWVGFQPQCNR